MSETPPAGWYPDPHNASQQRYWDGGTWTEHTAPAVQQAAPPSGTSAPQPAAAGGGQAVGSPPDPWLWQSIVATLLCCLPAGVVGIVFAAKSQSAATAGDLAGAQQAANTARTWTLVSAGIGLLIIPLFLFFAVIGGMSGY